MTNKKLLISFDGGGARGIGPAYYLSKLLEVIPTFKVDAWAGTSVGSLVAALAALYEVQTLPQWEYAVALFKENLPKIFTTPSASFRLNPLNPKYDGANLKMVLDRIFRVSSTGKPILLSELKTPIFIPTFDMAKGKIKVFDITDKVPVSYAVLCSCAAPSYFAAVQRRYMDGGLVVNNPSMVGYAGCIGKYGWDPSSIYCLSLGTGDSWSNPGTEHCLIGWIQPILEACLDGGEEVGEYQMGVLLGDRFKRVDPKLPTAIKLDDVKSALTTYLTIWDKVVKADAEGIKPWLLRYLNL